MPTSSFCKQHVEVSESERAFERKHATQITHRQTARPQFAQSETSENITRQKRKLRHAGYDSQRTPNCSIYRRPADVFSFSFQSNLISWFGETFSSCPDSKQPLRHLWANFHCGNCTVLGSLGQNRPCALLLNLSPAGVEALSPGTAGKYRQVCVWLLGEGVKEKNGGRMGGVDMCRGWWWRGWGCLLGSAVLFFFFFYKQPWQRLLCSPGHSRLETPSW